MASVRMTKKVRHRKGRKVKKKNLRDKKEDNLRHDQMMGRQVFITVSTDSEIIITSLTTILANYY